MEKHLQDTSGKKGQACTLSCQLSVPDVEAQWFKNGRRLELKGRYRSEVEHKVQRLLISDLEPEDQGRYSCRYQHLESSAELWVEGLYPETKPGLLPPPLTSFRFHKTMNLTLHLWISHSFLTFSLVGFLYFCVLTVLLG